MPATPNPAPQLLALGPALSLKTFRHPARGSAHGCSGWRMEHYALVAEHVVMTDSVETSTLFKVASAIAADRAPPPPLLCAPTLQVAAPSACSSQRGV